MRSDQRHVVVSVLVVVAAALASVLARRQPPAKPADSTANLRARVVERAPDGAPIVDAMTVFQHIPVARAAVRRAVRRRGKEWTTVKVEGEGAWDIPALLHRDLPYYAARATEPHPEGVYVRHDDHIVVIDAVGWASVEDGR